MCLSLLTIDTIVTIEEYVFYCDIVFFFKCGAHILPGSFNVIFLG